MSDSSRVQLQYCTETTFATPPASLTMQLLRFTSENLKHNNATVVSDEIRADRMRSDLLLVGVDVAGDVAFEFSQGTWDDLLQGALCGTWTANVLKNGVTPFSYLFERGMMDINQFFQYRGAEVNGFHLDIAQRAIVKGTFNIMAAQTVISGTTLATGSTATTTTTPMTSGPCIANIETNTNMTGIKATSLRLDLTNNLRARHDVESKASAQFGMGVQDVTGTMQFYFANSQLMTAFLANTAQAFTFSTLDPDTPAKKYDWLMPKVKFTDHEVVTPGIDQDIIANLGFRALYSQPDACHLKITRAP